MTVNSDEIRAQFERLLEPVAPATRARVFEQALRALPPWVEGADIIPVAYSLFFDPKLLPGGPFESHLTVSLRLTLGRALIALGEHERAIELLTDLSSESKQLAGFETIRRALLMRLAVRIGEIESALMVKSTILEPNPNDDSQDADWQAEVCLSLGLVQRVQGDLSLALVSFDRALTFAARHQFEDLALNQAFLALMGQATTSLLIGDPAAASSLANAALGAASRADAQWEAALAMLFREATRAMTGEPPAMNLLEPFGAVLRRPPALNSQVDLFHGLPVEPMAGPVGSSSKVAYAASLLAAMGNRARALDPTSVALSAVAAACLLLLADQVEDAKAAIAQGQATIDQLGLAASPSAQWLEQAWGAFA